MEILKKIIVDKLSMPEASLKKLTDIMTLNKLPKNHIIAKEGVIPVDLYIIKNGIARSYYTDRNCKEYTRSLFTFPDGAGALGALALQKPSRLTYECLTDCEVYQFNYKEFKQLIKEDIHISNFYVYALEKVFLRLDNKIYDITLFNATERYVRLKDQIPEIENMIPQYQIASYLNITPVQLSRIRKKLYSK
ncbi:Crp/Fnr family transcriptional regulator [Polaribacter sp.]|nr:Crp/Fnr family transcriptional regulator [Polaribacter sp.]